MTMTDQERADKSAAAMWAGDDASKALGIVLDSVAPGKAVATLLVEQRHLNGHKICHGGYIFTLADTAFAFACNSYNNCVVAQQNSITFLSSGKLDETLVASAHEVSRKGRSGVYDVMVRNEAGEDIAAFRGNSRMISGTNFPEDAQ
jgi:acyl-CoA thioesterase